VPGAGLGIRDTAENKINISAIMDSGHRDKGHISK
jgi:hypothetical protein